MNNLSIRKRNELSKGKKKGFTLVELIIVIAIIAVLAAIAIPKFGEVTRNANIKADISTAKNIHGIVAQLVAEGTEDISTDAKLETAIIAKIDSSATAMPITKATKTSFEAAYTKSSGAIVVTDGTTQIYPNTATTYGK